MIVGRVRTAVSLAAAALVVVFASLASFAFSGTAAAADFGTQLSNAIQAQSPFSPGTLDSGQGVDVVVPSGDLLPTTETYILECSAPGGTLPTSFNSCDGNTEYAGGSLVTNGDGSLDVLEDGESGSPYPIYLLPDSYTFEEPASSPTDCGLGSADECVLYIGQEGPGGTLGAEPYVWSQPFQVHPDPTDSGSIDPGDGTFPADSAPAITSGNSATFQQGTHGTFTVTATGWAPPHFSVTAGTLPHGVTLTTVASANTTTGSLSGTPTQSGTFDFTITASNGVGTAATQPFTLTVQPPAQSPPTITSGDAATFTAGESNTFTVTATGTPAPTITETGALPSGVSLSSTGVLSGSPTAIGTFDFTITASNGVSPNATQPFTLTVNPNPTAPNITKVSPDYGPAAGGTAVTITGVNFATGDTVKFGSTSATVTKVTSTSIKATSPAGTGTVNITVSSATQTSATSPADYFSYGPLVTKVSPDMGSPSGGTFTVDGVVYDGTKVTITGKNFGSGDTVDFGAGNPAGVVSVSSTGTSIVVASPAEVGSGVQTVNVSVTSSTTGASPTETGDEFTYAAPTITKIAPLDGPGGGATKVTITGKYLGGTSAVSFGSTPAESFTVSATNTSIKAVAPAGTGTVGVTVTTAAGTVTLPTAYTYNPPTISHLAPASGPGGGGNKVTISGSNLFGTSSVTIGGVSAALVKVTDGSVQVDAPAGGSGAETVVVTTPAGSATDADAYTYLAPTITHISPTSGSGGGGTKVTISGTELVGASTVKFGSTVVSPSDYTVSTSGTSITVTAAPPGSGDVNVSVTTSAGTATSSGTFDYQAPRVTSLSPKDGPVATPVTIHGSDFTGASSVAFGTTVLTSGFTVNATGTTITVNSPSGPTGTVDVTVTNTAGTSAIVTGDKYTYS